MWSAGALACVEGFQQTQATAPPSHHTKTAFIEGPPAPALRACVRTQLKCRVGLESLYGHKIVIALDQIRDHHGRETYSAAAPPASGEDASFCGKNGMGEPVRVVIDTVDRRSRNSVTRPESL